MLIDFREGEGEGGIERGKETSMSERNFDHLPITCSWIRD